MVAIAASGHCSAVRAVVEFFDCAYVLVKCCF